MPAALSTFGIARWLFNLYYLVYNFLIGTWVLPWQKRKNPLLGDKKHFFTEITQLHTLISAIDFQFLQCNRQNKLQNRPITYY